MLPGLYYLSVAFCLTLLCILLWPYILDLFIHFSFSNHISPGVGLPIICDILIKQPLPLEILRYSLAELSAIMVQCAHVHCAMHYYFCSICQEHGHFAIRRVFQNTALTLPRHSCSPHLQSMMFGSSSVDAGPALPLPLLVLAFSAPRGS